MKMNSEAALRHAGELTKILCENPNTKIDINDESAKTVGQFLLTLAETLCGATEE
ncbi:MAG: hypothetical protein RSD74_01995 [Angelakisella sp.]